MGFDKEEAAAASWRYSLALPHASPESEAINKAVRDVARRRAEGVAAPHGLADNVWGEP